MRTTMNTKALRNWGRRPRALRNLDRRSQVGANSSLFEHQWYWNSGPRRQMIKPEYPLALAARQEFQKWQVEDVVVLKTD
jgi:hypothetical protein